MDIQYLKSVLKYVLSAILSVVLIAYILYHMSGGFQPDIETTPATLVTQESTMTVSITVMRNETVLFSPISGDISYLYNDGERVAIHTAVAEVYPSATGSEDQRRRIIELDRKIRILEQSNMSDAEKRTDTTFTDTLIRQNLYDILEQMERSDISGADNLADALLVQLNRRRIITRAVANYNDRITELKEELNTLNSGGTAVEDTITSPAGGYFYSVVDGFENIFTSANIEDLDYLEFLELMDRDAESYNHFVDGYPVGKLVTDYTWYAACVINADQLHNFETGKNHDVKFPYNDGVTLSMYLYRILSDVDSETAVLIFRTNILPEGFNYLRNQTVQVVQSSYTGYRIPASAIHIVNGKAGVYILRGSQVSFRRIEPLYESDGYILVKERDESASDRGNWLAKNDFVITKGKDLYDGKIVG